MYDLDAKVWMLEIRTGLWSPWRPDSFHMIDTLHAQLSERLFIFNNNWAEQIYCMYTL